MSDRSARIAEIRQENRSGDVSYRDIEWLCLTVERLSAAMDHVVNDSPGTPESVKTYLFRELEGSWGARYEAAMIVPAGDERCDFVMDACVCMKRKGHGGLHACAHGGWRG